MARPREFDEAVALDAAIQCFWSRGYEATSVRDLADAMGIAGPSLYNTFGDKRTLYRQALEHYVERGFCDRVRRFESQLAPRAAIGAFFDEIRYHVDKLELLVDDASWYLPKYRELLFLR